MRKGKTIVPKDIETIVCRCSHNKQTHNQCDVRVRIIGVFDYFNETPQYLLHTKLGVVKASWLPKF